MIYYAAHPSTTKETIDELSRWPWRWMISPWTPKPPWGGMPDRRFAIDNGAYGFHLRNLPFDDAKFLKILDKYGHLSDFVCIPDKVGDADETFRLFDEWHARLSDYKCLFVVQDGMAEAQVEALLPLVEGIFIGGTTEWKLKTIPQWSDFAKRNNKTIHVGRVNTIKRIKFCRLHGVDSIDGSGVSRFRNWAKVINNWLLFDDRQLKLF